MLREVVEHTDGLHVIDRRDLVAAISARQQHAPEPRFMQRRHQIGRDLAGGLNSSRGGGDDRGQRPGVGDAVDSGPVVHIHSPP
jgi:hypothetical protein